MEEISSDYNNLDDEALQALASSGNMEAQDVLLRRYSRTVKMCARPYFLAGGDEEDLIQEGMLGLFNAIKQFDPGYGVSFRTYAEKCIRNMLITAVKSASRYKHSPLNSYISFESPQFDEIRTQQGIHGSDPEEQVIARESSAEIAAALFSCLSDFESEILELYLEGLSYSEMAEKTKKSAKSVDNAVQRIRKKVARLYYSGDFSES